jgi:hypothetical protein
LCHYVNRCNYGAKVRISEHKTKQKTLFFVFVVEQEIAKPHSVPLGQRTFDEVKGTNKRAKKQINVTLFWFLQKEFVTLRNHSA